MKKRLFIFIFSFITLLGYSQLSIRSTIATTDCSTSFSDEVPQEVLDAAGCSSDTNTTPTEPPLVNTAIRIINGIIAVLSIIAVIFIIYGGIQYMTSTGDTGKTKRAKDTILYAAIGLIVCALAAGIVNFVVVNLLGNSTSEGSSISQSESQSSSQSESQSNSQQNQSTPQNSSSLEEETEPDDVTPINTTTPLIHGEGITFKNDNNCLIKGDISKTKFDENGEPEKIYHLPGQRRYAETKIEGEEQYFCTEQEAIDAGFRPANSKFSTSDETSDDNSDCTIKAYTDEYGKKLYLLPYQLSYGLIENATPYCTITDTENAGYVFNNSDPFVDVKSSD